MRHIDRFDFWLWSRQALGTTGLLLGWSGFPRGKVRAKAAAGLAGFMRSVEKRSDATAAVKPRA